MSIHEELRQLLRRRSVMQGEFKLVSGRTSDFYVDSKLTTLDPRGAWLIGAAGWEILQEEKEARQIDPELIGGMTMGADPIALAIAMVSAQRQQEEPLQMFSVRKSPKPHGRNRLIEGNFEPGRQVIVVDDVVTTGGSTIKAIEAVREAGGEVVFALVLVDREEGGRENIEALDVPVRAIFARTDLTGE